MNERDREKKRLQFQMVCSSYSVLRGRCRFGLLLVQNRQRCISKPLRKHRVIPVVSLVVPPGLRFFSNGVTYPSVNIDRWRRTELPEMRSRSPLVVDPTNIRSDGATDQAEPAAIMQAAGGGLTLDAALGTVRITSGLTDGGLDHG
jgi:hypothetical protein